MNRIRPTLIKHLVAWLVLAAANLKASELQEQYSHWPEDLKINGRIVVTNGLSDSPTLVQTMQQVASGKEVLILQSESDADYETQYAMLKDAVGPDGSITTIQSTDASIKSLADAISAADCVFVDRLLGSKESHRKVKAPLHELIRRGGTLIAGADAAIRLGKQYFVSGESSETEEGLHLLPDCVLTTSSATEQLETVLARTPRLVGIHMDDDSAWILTGRKIVAIGSGKVTLMVTRGTAKEAASVTISSENDRRRSIENSMADLTQWRRMAIDRDLPPFPGDKPPTPFVENGTLIIVGGGGSPRGMMSRFVELAGGLEQARLVYVPCSERESVGERQSMVAAWEKMGVKHATFIHTKDRTVSNTDEEFLAPLKDATGIFFGGGRQWNFSDSYYGTKAHALMKDVLKRGGVIAGSSAGASIQGRYLARATPIGNFKIMAPGYERGGLGFLTGVAIDQHFSQRGRQRDMTGLIKVYPQLLGIGLDEATAIEVQKSVAKVTGRGRVFFYDAGAASTDDQRDYIALPSGSTYDLANRKILEDTREESDSAADR